MKHEIPPWCEGYLRRCSRCGHDFPATTDYFHAHRGGLFGLRGICKTCKAICEKATRTIRRFNKVCVVCGDPFVTKYHKATCCSERCQAKRRKSLASQKTAQKRAMAAEAFGSFTDDELVAQAKRQRNKCYWCGKKLGQRPHSDYHPDHVLPISKSKDNSISNIVAACVKCNLSKNNKMPWEWSGNNGRMF